ncbi:MAG: DUF6166 domain-containing protein [Candidatus Nanohaloarchaea archaeon]
MTTETGDEFKDLQVLDPISDDTLELAQHPDTVYTAEMRGEGAGAWHRIVVSPPDERDYLLPPRTDVEKISEFHDYNAFDWGYKGSGACLTAGSLVADAYQDREAARQNMGRLVDRYVSRVESGEGWTVTAGEIHELLTGE